MLSEAVKLGRAEGVRGLTAAAYRRVNKGSSAGLPWKRKGDLITFDWNGFVEATSAPELFARHHYETTLIRRLIGDRRAEQSLELGCGFGRLSPTFADLSDNHIAVDINESAVSAARTAYPDLDFRVVSGSTLDFADDSFDLVVTWTVVQHVRPELIEQTMSEIMRVLRPGGRLLMCEETRNAGAPSHHCWHRDVADYARWARPLELAYSAPITEIERLPNALSPGQVMLFAPAE